MLLAHFASAVVRARPGVPDGPQRHQAERARCERLFTSPQGRPGVSYEHEPAQPQRAVPAPPLWGRLGSTRYAHLGAAVRVAPMWRVHRHAPQDACTDEPDENGPFFLHFPPRARFSFDIETAMVGGGDDAEEAYCAVPPAPSRQAASYSSFNEDLAAVGIYHNRIAADRGWVLLDLVRLSFHAWRHGAIANVFVLKHGELAICIAFHLRSAAVMKHYIAEKLGVLMPGNALANLAGAAVATDHDDEQRCFKYSLAAAFSRVIVSHAQAYELPGVTNDTVVRWWIGHSRRRVLSVRVVCVAIVSTTNAVGGLSTL